MPFRIAIVTVALAGLSACGPAREFTVSGTPLSLLGDPNHPGFCIAVDPKHPRGIWTFAPTEAKCPSPSGSAGITRARGATVSVTPGGRVEAAFELDLLPGGVRQVRLVVHGGWMIDIDGSVSAPAEVRRDLTVPAS
jgi:hypothetical protein